MAFLIKWVVLSADFSIQTSGSRFLLQPGQPVNTRTFRVAAWGAGALFSAYMATLVLSGPALKQVVSDIGLIFLALGAAGSSFAAAAKEAGRYRKGWALMGASATSWAIGETLWSYYELVAHRPVPFPSFADVAYLGAPALAIPALLLFPASPSHLRSKVRTLIDALLIASSLLLVSWVTVVGPLYRAGGESLLETAIGVAYPISDVALASIVFFLVLRAGRRGRLPLALLGAGVLSFVFADSSFAYLTLNELYVSGNPIDGGWAGGYLLIALAAIRAIVEPERKPRVPRLGRLGVLLPVAAVAVAVGVVGTLQIADGRLDGFVIWTSIAIVVLVSCRQILTLLENISLNRTLEQKVRDRTADLEVALRRLEEAKGLQDQFVSNTSHELRTPLTVILGSVRTLMRPQFELAAEGRGLLESAERNAVRMIRLVEDLLLTSSVRGEIARASEPFDASTELRAAVVNMASGEKPIELSAPESLPALGDAERFRIIVEHLLSNASKFSPDGTTVRITGSSGDYGVTVTVRDQGPGIPPELRSKVFDRFVQLEGGSTRHHRGVGLGLFLARRLAESMGGDLVIDDVGPPGASFTLRIPSAPDAA